MKNITALLLATGMAVTMIPATAMAQDSTTVSGAASSMTMLHLDGASMDQIASASTAVAIFVDGEFDSSMEPGNIGDIRTAIDANVSLTAYLESEEMDSSDVVGVAVDGESNLMLFVTGEFDENDWTGTLSEDGTISLNAALDADLDGVLDVNGNSNGDSDSSVNADANVGLDVGADVNLEGDDDDEDGISLDLGVGLGAETDTSVSTN